MAAPGGAGGFILGSNLIKKLSLTTAQQLRAMFFLAIAGLFSMFAFAIQCDTARLADMPPQQHTQPTDMLVNNNSGLAIID